MIYVSSPYSHDNSVIRDRRFRIAKEFIIHCLLEEKVAVFSSIVYWHEMSKEYKLPGDANFYMTFNMNMLRRSECLFLLKIPGWDVSQGVKVETTVARTLRIPIIEFDKDFINLTAGQNGADNTNG
jgi:hypothetical protein